MNSSCASRSLDTALSPLRVSAGILLVIFGLDAFLNFLTDWFRYVSPTLVGALNMDATRIMYWVGALQILLGAAILRWPRRGAIALTIWLSLVALNLVAGGILDLALIAILQAVGFFTFARLCTRNEKVVVPIAPPVESRVMA